LGLNYGPLNDAQRHRLERNTGLQVAIVVRGTPAFKANFLEGDILLKMNGTDITDVPSFSADVMKLAGQRVTFDLLRGDEPRTISLTLNP
jgi:S1-C subfamily serine protease